MLVLSRKSGETIEIGDEICVEVLSVRGKRVQIGIRAPKSVCILRGELPQKHEVVELTSQSLLRRIPTDASLDGLRLKAALSMKRNPFPKEAASPLL